MNAELSSQRLDDLAECAYRLGKVFAAEAEQADAVSRKVEFYHLFNRCFASVRLSIALQLRLRREAARGETSVRAAVAREPDSSDHDRPERDPPEIETERERERETVSFPVLLRTLHGVAADASALPGPPPAELPVLRELLASLAPRPDERSARDPTPPPSALRARLARSATLTALAPPAPAPPGPDPRTNLRRATGPP